MEILRVEDLNFAYADQETPGEALKNIGFSLEEGELLCLCGPTGSGKSTLLRLLKREISPRGKMTGKIFIAGRNRDEMSDAEAAAEVGFVSQRPEMQIVTDKVWHELAFGLENLCLPQNEIRRRVCEIAGYFGMESWFERSTDSLSGGQKQLLNLASVMVMQPSLLILDEPVSQLDPIAASDFIATIKKLCREFGISVIAAEQRLEELAAVSDRMIVMDNGRIAASGKTESCVRELLWNEKFSRYLPCAARMYAKLMKGRDGQQNADPAPESTVPLSVSDGRRFLKEYVKTGGTDGEPNDAGVSDGPGKNAGSSKYALEFREVYLRYGQKGEDVLKNLTLQIKAGEIFCILGGNGAGKSTAVCAAAGLLKPYSGKIKVFDRNIKEYRGQELYRECVALLPQDVQTVFLTDEINGRHPYDLSGGEQQLAALDIVLATKPMLLLLDEPTKGLDPDYAGRLRIRLKELADSGVTIVIVTHDVEFASEVADRCAMLFRGEAVSVGNVSEFFKDNYFYTTAMNRIMRGISDGAGRAW